MTRLSEFNTYDSFFGGFVANLLNALYVCKGNVTHRGWCQFDLTKAI